MCPLSSELVPPCLQARAFPSPSNGRACLQTSGLLEPSIQPLLSQEHQGLEQSGLTRGPAGASPMSRQRNPCPQWHRDQAPPQAKASVAATTCSAPSGLGFKAKYWFVNLSDLGMRCLCLGGPSWGCVSGGDLRPWVPSNHSGLQHLWGAEGCTRQSLVSPSPVSFIPGHEGLLHGGGRSVHSIPPILDSAGVF